MKLLDIIIAVVSGEAAALVFSEFFGEKAFILMWFFLFLGPVLAIISLWLADFFAKKFLFVSQFVKYCLIGIIAMLADLKIFDFLIFIFGFNVGMISGVSKGISFLISVFVKFLGNKYWTFEESKKEGISKEFIAFLLVTFFGLIIDVTGFFFFARILGPQFGVSTQIWAKISVVLAGICAAIWNFLCYKFIIFKK
jgi:putative flippase GtrA